MAPDEAYIIEFKIWFLFSYTLTGKLLSSRKIYNRLEVMWHSEGQKCLPSLQFFTLGLWDAGYSIVSVERQRSFFLTGVEERLYNSI